MVCIVVVVFVTLSHLCSGHAELQRQITDLQRLELRRWFAEPAVSDMFSTMQQNLPEMRQPIDDFLSCMKGAGTFGLRSV